jgi:two-component system OmpR family sensor kinase
MRTLYTRLIGGLLTLLIVIGGIVLWLSVYNARHYRHEVTQKLHLNLAKSLVKESMLMSGGMIYAEAVEDVFHTLMVINPAIEVYLLDATGQLLRYSAPEGKVKLAIVSLEPLTAFLDGTRQLPILGQDPRHPGSQKVFSVAPIIEEGITQGYLYVILESGEYAATADTVWGSNALRFSATVLAATLLFALSAGGMIFYFLTRRLRELDNSVEAFRDGNFEFPPAAPGALATRDRDEIDRLAGSFHQMSMRIVELVGELRKTDNERRQLIANVSHDLRTPLASLKGYLDTLMIKDSSLTANERRQYLEIASKSSARLEMLINDLFELAKLESTETRLDIESC